MKIIVYMDGGSQKADGPFKHRFVLSWGLIVHHQDTTVELHGAKDQVHQEYSGSHEHIAFVEALRHAMTHDIAPDELAFVTDDSSVCDVNHWARVFGRLDLTSNTIKRLLNLVKYLGFDSSMDAYMLRCLEWSKFQKVKGHARTVYNLRCDELAVHARNWVKGDLSPLLPFEEWLHDGHIYYDKEQNRKTWFAPFSDQHVDV